MTRRMDELNALEEAEAEQRSGSSILALENEQPVAKLLAALAWVHKRRTDPKLQYGEYLKQARTKDNVRYLFHDDAEDEDDDDAEDDAPERDVYERPDVLLTEDEEPKPKPRVIAKADEALSGGPHPDAEDRALDDQGVPTDPFRETGSPVGAEGASAEVADAEGTVLPLERGTA